MRDSPPPLRERTSLTVRASRTARRLLAERGRDLAVAAGAAVFLAFSGAFGSGDAPYASRLVYWGVLMVGGSLLGGTVARTVRERGWFEDRLWRQAALVTVAIAVPMTVLVWAYTELFWAGRLRTELLPLFAGPVLLVSAVMTALSYMANRQPPETHASPAGAPPPRFLDRLPPKLRGAEVYAVEAEDHYLRLHTSRGSDLILMRLADAVAELEGIEGAQTHRSWWVAKDAVVSAARSDGRATLTLKGGAAAPVSRTYAKALRDEGWF